MPTQIKGLHHVTSLASSASDNNAFFTETLGLRRVKKTVNFDAPDVYHLYYGDEHGSPGTVMTYFPFPMAARGRPGVGEVGTVAFSVPKDSLSAWARRLAGRNVRGLEEARRFGEKLLAFPGPDGDGFVLVENERDDREPWTGGGVPEDMAIRGFHSVTMRLEDDAATAELLRFMGFGLVGSEGGVTRFAIPEGNGAHIVDLEKMPTAPAAEQGAGSVHHIAFSVENRARQLELREALLDKGYNVTPVVDRDYFWAIYFRAPGGVLFEIATNEPGFDRDEDIAHLGETLKLPSRHEHLRQRLERALEPIGETA